MIFIRQTHLGESDAHQQGTQYYRQFFHFLHPQYFREVPLCRNRNENGSTFIINYFYLNNTNNQFY